MKRIFLFSFTFTLLLLSFSAIAEEVDLQPSRTESVFEKRLREHHGDNFVKMLPSHLQGEFPEFCWLDSHGNVYSKGKFFSIPGYVLASDYTKNTNCPVFSDFYNAEIDSYSFSTREHAYIERMEAEIFSAKMSEISEKCISAIPKGEEREFNLFSVIYHDSRKMIVCGDSYMKDRNRDFETDEENRYSVDIRPRMAPHHSSLWEYRLKDKSAKYLGMFDGYVLPIHRSEPLFSCKKYTKRVSYEITHCILDLRTEPKLTEVSTRKPGESTDGEGDIVDVQPQISITEDLSAVAEFKKDTEEVCIYAWHYDSVELKGTLDIRGAMSVFSYKDTFVVSQYQKEYTYLQRIYPHSLAILGLAKFLHRDVSEIVSSNKLIPISVQDKSFRFQILDLETGELQPELNGYGIPWFDTCNNWCFGKLASPDGRYAIIPLEEGCQIYNIKDNSTTSLSGYPQKTVLRGCGYSNELHCFIELISLEPESGENYIPVLARTIRIKDENPVASKFKNVEIPNCCLRNHKDIFLRVNIEGLFSLLMHPKLRDFAKNNPDYRYCREYLNMHLWKSRTGDKFVVTDRSGLLEREGISPSEILTIQLPKDLRLECTEGFETVLVRREDNETKLTLKNTRFAGGLLACEDPQKAVFYLIDLTEGKILSVALPKSKARTQRCCWIEGTTLAITEDIFHNAYIVRASDGYYSEFSLKLKSLIER